VDSDGQRSSGQRQALAGDGAPRVPLPGVVTDVLPSAMYRVRLEEGHLVLAHIADRIDRNFVRVLVGDRVGVELSPVDAGRGRIVEKLK
jgi:translation initiation factor IF-1